MNNEELLARYERWLSASGLTDGTIRLRMLHARRLARDVQLTLATSDHLEQALAATRHLSRETRHSILASWRKIYRWAIDKRLVLIDPTEGLGSIPVPIRMPKVAPDHAVKEALRGASSRDAALILLGRYAFLRLTEMTTLRIEQRDGERLHIRGKGDKDRIVYLNEVVLAALRVRERELGSGYYFPGKTDGHLHTQSVHKIIKRVTGWNPHSLRHAGATAAYRSTRNLRAVQSLLGHSSLATTEVYLHLDDEAMRAAAAGAIIDLAA